MSDVPVLIELHQIRNKNKSKILVPVRDIVVHPVETDASAPPGTNAIVAVDGSQHYVAESMEQIVALSRGEAIDVSASLSSLTWNAGVVTAKATAAFDFPVGSKQRLVIAKAAPAGYNGTFDCTVVDAVTFTYPLATNPGAATAPGTYAPAT